MERKLASIKKIDKITKHPNADSLEICHVGGWRVVTKIGEYTEGDLAVYFEIDSFLPMEKDFEFLRKSSFKKMGDQEGFRLKTIKLRNTLSQGLILPYSVIPIAQFASAYDLPEGMDVSEMLGIVKYEPPVPAQLAGKVKGSFPSFLRKTDEERIQNLEKEYTEWGVSSKHQFYATEKLDGSSFTCYLKDGVFGVCSRNLDLLETEDNTFWQVARSLDLENKLKSLGKNICFQGEMIGSGIQGNHYKMKEQTVFFYNIYLIDEMKYSGFYNFRQTLMDLELLSVPVLSLPFQFPADKDGQFSVSALLKEAEGKSILNSEVEREGLVIRSMDRTISFKAISNKFLLGERA